MRIYQHETSVYVGLLHNNCYKRIFRLEWLCHPNRAGDFFFCNRSPVRFYIPTFWNVHICKKHNIRSTTNNNNSLNLIEFGMWNTINVIIQWLGLLQLVSSTTSRFCPFCRRFRGFVFFFYFIDQLVRYCRI